MSKANRKAAQQVREVMVSHVTVVDGVRKLIEKGLARFHQFGVDYEEFEASPGNYSTAIVEWPDGSIQGVPLHLVRFADQPPAPVSGTGEAR